jgi:hypothetical protein
MLPSNLSSERAEQPWQLNLNGGQRGRRNIPKSLPLPSLRSCKSVDTIMAVASAESTIGKKVFYNSTDLRVLLPPLTPSSQE